MIMRKFIVITLSHHSAHLKLAIECKQICTEWLHFRGLDLGQWRETMMPTGQFFGVSAGCSVDLNLNWSKMASTRLCSTSYLNSYQSSCFRILSRSLFTQCDTSMLSSKVMWWHIFSRPLTCTMASASSSSSASSPSF